MEYLNISEFPKGMLLGVVVVRMIVLGAYIGFPLFWKLPFGFTDFTGFHMSIFFKGLLGPAELRLRFRVQGLGLAVYRRS